MTESLSKIEILWATERIKQVKVRYFRALDTKDWDLLRTVFTDDARFDVRGAFEMPGPDRTFQDPPVVCGGQQIASFCSEILTPLVSAHHGHLAEISVVSDTYASAVWPMQDVLHSPAGGEFRTFRGYGYYHEQFRKEDGEWRIADLVLRRLFVDIER